MGSGNKFSAVAASLGYAYQLRYALLLALKRQQIGPNWAIAVETGDDLEFSGGDDDALIQLKHRAAGTSLTDGSADLWKTLRVWSEALKTGTLKLPDTQLILITTATAKSDSICARLTAEPRSLEENTTIAEGLRSVAAGSGSNTLSAAHDSYLSLTHGQQCQLVAAIQIVDDSPSISQADSEIRSLAHLMVRIDHVDGFMERLEGWWNRRCLRQLALGLDEAVLGVDFDAFLSELREKFHLDNLPIDEDIAGERPEIDPFLNMVFCQQLTFFDLGLARIAIAVRDYHRAFVQRSRWSQLGLLRYGELDQYERQLREAWELLFERMKEDLGPTATEDMKLKAAREIYAWAESADFPIRPACTEGFVTRGSLHMLADDRQVGWHPDFELLLAAIFEEEQVEVT